MNIFEMMRTGELHPMTLFMPIQMLVIGLLCYLLAKSKGRNFKLAILFGIIPALNVVALIYYVGVSKLENIKQ